MNVNSSNQDLEIQYHTLRLSLPEERDANKLMFEEFKALNELEKDEIIDLVSSFKLKAQWRQLCKALKTVQDI